MPRPLSRLLLLAAAALLLACGAPSRGDARGKRPPVRPQKIQEKVQVTLPDGLVVKAELADDPAERAIGLMGREDVPEGKGMLFVLESAGHSPFYMKGMLTSIDILWLSEEAGGGRVVHIARQAQPCEKDPCPNYFPALAARYVLELRAGAADRHGAQEGALVRFTLPAPVPPAR